MISSGIKAATAVPSGRSRIQLESNVNSTTVDGKHSSDLHMSMVIQNRKLDAVEKMQYLKTHLTDKVEHVIQHMNVNGGNYHVALEARRPLNRKRAIAWN